MSRILGIVLALALFGGNVFAESAKPQVVILTPEGRRAAFNVELARSHAERAKGLMGRSSLAANAGMLFIFDEVDVKTFWMKNTPLSLDLLFIDAKGVVVGIVEKATPNSTKTLAVGTPSRDVLEIAGGESARRGLGVGSVVQYIDVPGRP